MISQLYYGVTTRNCRLLLKKWFAAIFFLLAVLLLVLAVVAAPAPHLPRQQAPYVQPPSLARHSAVPVKTLDHATVKDEAPVHAAAVEQVPVPKPPVVEAPVAPKPKRRPATKIHPMYKTLIREYPFQPVRTNKGEFVNIILVRAPFGGAHHERMFEKYKDEILFIGFSSFEVYPFSSPNPYSGNFPQDKYVGMFPGFLHMVHEPQKVFPPHVKALLMSQSDFSLPHDEPSTDKLYDFTFSGSDQDVHNDCVGWASFAKNWSFVKQALDVMCGELDMKGVLAATMDKQGKKACSIPASCKGKITQTKYLDQGKFFDYVKHSKFVFLPQIFDASPRVSTQAMALNVPVLMNQNIAGGWKYVNEQTGQFFHDMSDFREKLAILMQNIDEGQYKPREWVYEHFDDNNSGKKLKNWVEQHFADRCTLPAGTELLFPAGA